MALKFRTIDGSDNNLSDPALNQANTDFAYSEFLPHLLGPDAIPAYHGYDPNVNPTITEEFEGVSVIPSYRPTSMAPTTWAPPRRNKLWRTASSSHRRHSPPMAAPMDCCGIFPAIPRNRWILILLMISEVF